MVTGEQIRAARAMLRLSQRQFAELAHVSENAVRRMERTRGPLPIGDMLVEAVRTAVEAAGVHFIEAGAYSRTGGAGVRLAGEVLLEDKIVDFEAIEDTEGERDVVAEGDAQ